MKITGKYTTDSNFTTVFVEKEKKIYTIASTGDWGSVTVGQKTAMGQLLTENVFNNMMAECEREGTFELE